MEPIVTLALLALPLTPPAQEVEDLFVVQCSGLDGLIVDPRDAGLRELLGLMDARLAELPDELGDDFDLPPDALPLVARLLTSPMSMRIGRDAAAEDFPFFAELRCARGSEEAARETVALAARLLGELDMEPTEPDSQGVRTLPAPVPTTLATEGSELVLAVGAPPVEPLALRSTYLPDGVAPALVVQADCGGLLELMAMEEDARPFVEALRTIGLGAATFSWSTGYEADAGISVTALAGCAGVMQERGLLAKTGLSPASLRAVPADATWASVSQFDLHGGWRWMTGFLRDQGLDLRELDEMLEQFTIETGVELERDLLAPLGSLLGMYASETTGGGGLLSTVLFVEVDDPDTLTASMRRVEARLNELAREEADGYVHIRRRASAAGELISLTFPGLPIPLEPTWAMSNGFLVVGATPQAVEAAVTQIAGGGPDLTTSPRFAQALPGGCEGALSMTYVDSARFVREGYGTASMCMSALSNALRSRTDASRLAGPALPPYAALAGDARAYVSTTRVVGDAIVVETRFDRSLSVNLAASAGYISSLTGGAPMMVLAPGLLATLLVPRVVEATQSARGSVAKADILMITSACDEYYINNGGVWPDDLGVLVVPDENGNRYLREPELPVDPWGQPYRYDPPTAAEALPRIYTLGRDGAPGGVGEDRDLDNWMLADGDY